MSLIGYRISFSIDLFLAWIKSIALMPRKVKKISMEQSFISAIRVPIKSLPLGQSDRTNGPCFACQITIQCR
jgi:hypothetical protein